MARPWSLKARPQSLKGKAAVSQGKAVVSQGKQYYLMCGVVVVDEWEGGGGVLFLRERGAWQLTFTSLKGNTTSRRTRKSGVGVACSSREMMACRCE